MVLFPIPSFYYYSNIDNQGYPDSITCFNINFMINFGEVIGPFYSCFWLGELSKISALILQTLTMMYKIYYYHI